MITPALAAIDTGAEIGFATNVNRAIDDDKDDTYLAAYVNLGRDIRGESRFDWLFNAAIRGTRYMDVEDLSSVSLSVMPGVIYLPHHSWAFSLTPFVQATAMQDSDQSSFDYGARINARQRLNPDLYMGQYYMYTNSNAEEDVYSFEENAFGLYLGGNPTRSIFAEVHYEYAQSDSFRSVSSTDTTVIQKGKGNRVVFSSTFDTVVIKDDLERQTVGADAGLSFGASWTLLAGYAYSYNEGDIDSYSSHAGYVALEYRFDRD